MLDIKKVSIFSKYADYTNVFSPDFAVELPEHTSINDHFIDLINDKQLPYSSIYNLRLVELEILKTFIKINLANNFIRPFKLPTNALILFIHKKDNSFQLYVNYWNLNNLIIKNWYLLLLISKFFNHLDHAKHFT